MIFLSFLFIIIIGGSIIRGILGLLFGRKPFRHTYGPTHGGNYRTDGTQQQQTRQSQSQQTTATDGKKREKIFDKSDGEYVDFEEIK